MIWLDFVMVGLNLNLPLSVLLLLPLLGMVAQQDQQRRELGLRETANILYALVSVLSACVTPLLRKGFGKEALFWPAFYAYILMWIVAGVNGSTSMVNYTCLWLIALLYQRLYTWWRYRKGDRCHSKFEGTTIFRLAGDAFAQTILEPLLCFGIGWYFREMGEEIVGVFLMVCGSALVLRLGMNRIIDARRTQAPIDARIEQEWLIRQIRKQG